jgi:hypothetical protein
MRQSHKKIKVKVPIRRTYNPLHFAQLLLSVQPCVPTALRNEIGGEYDLSHDSLAPRPIVADRVDRFGGLLAPNEKFTVSGFGGYPISHSMTSMWLAGPDHRPLVMVYFHGPEEWHNTKWKVDSKFEKGKPGWAELQSDSNSAAFDGHRNRESGSLIR